MASCSDPVELEAILRDPFEEWELDGEELSPNEVWIRLVYHYSTDAPGPEGESNEWVVWIYHFDQSSPLSDLFWRWIEENRPGWHIDNFCYDLHYVTDEYIDESMTPLYYGIIEYETIVIEDAKDD